MSTQRNSRRRETQRRGGFTLMEILLVLAILVVLGGLSMFAFQSTLRSAKIKEAKVQIGAWKGPISQYLLEFGQIPQTLDNLANPNSNDTSGNKQTVFLDTAKIPLDPWGNPYQYEPQGTKSRAGYDLYSTGPDGQAGTADDIGNWQ